MVSSQRGAVTLRLLSGNALGMVAFASTLWFGGDISVAAAAAAITGVLGYVGSGVLVEAYDL